MTAQRMERELVAPVQLHDHHVYLGGRFPDNRAEGCLVRQTGWTCMSRFVYWWPGVFEYPSMATRIPLTLKLRAPPQRAPMQKAAKANDLRLNKGHGSSDRVGFVIETVVFRERHSSYAR